MFQGAGERGGTRAVGKQAATAARVDSAIWYENEDEEEGNGKRNDAKDSRFV